MEFWPEIPAKPGTCLAFLQAHCHFTKIYAKSWPNCQCKLASSLPVILISYLLCWLLLHIYSAASVGFPDPGTPIFLQEDNIFKTWVTLYQLLVMPFCLFVSLHSVPSIHWGPSISFAIFLSFISPEVMQKMTAWMDTLLCCQPKTWSLIVSKWKTKLTHPIQWRVGIQKCYCHHSWHCCGYLSWNWWWSRGMAADIPWMGFFKVMWI